LKYAIAHLLSFLDVLHDVLFRGRRTGPATAAEAFGPETEYRSYRWTYFAVHVAKGSNRLVRSPPAELGVPASTVIAPGCCSAHKLAVSNKVLRWYASGRLMARFGKPAGQNLPDNQLRSPNRLARLCQFVPNSYQ